MREEIEKQKELESDRENNSGVSDSFPKKKKPDADIQKKTDAALQFLSEAKPKNLLSLFFQMNPFADWMYGLALWAAVFKDLLDFLNFTGIFYLVSVVLTFCVSIFIFLMMLLGSFSTGHGRKEQAKVKKYLRGPLVLLGGTTAELLLGLSFLPIETLSVILIYLFVLMERQQIKEEEKKFRKSNNYAEAYA